MAARSVLLACLTFVFGVALAQDWPAKPIRFIVPSSPGGGTDLYARILANALHDSLRQQIVIENRPGASGNIGAAATAKSPPDGYTFMVTANPSLTINPSLYPNLPYDPERDFAPVTRGVLAPQVFVAGPALKVATLAELVALGKKEPGKISYASGGTGTPLYLGVKMLEEKTGARYLHIPYKGAGAAYGDLLGGQVQFMFPDVASAISHIRAGKLRAIAVTQATPHLQGVPTLAQAGFPLDIVTSFSVVAPAGTPEPVIQRMASEVAAAMRSKAVAEKLDQQMLLPVFDTPAEFAASLKKERQEWAEFITRNGIKPD
ncbi:MAG TPA: tripartite tricarboxylate transporter substrate binding protein [Sphingomicrobium sp.]|nr:tripartite tricarboxylate transporter substrate binding protein [Sphingomicrobium sp.]